jgi:hypothetical protein
MQNCADQQNALQLELVRLTYEKHAVQPHEKLRNSLGQNYETVALPAELRRRKAAKDCTRQEAEQGRRVAQALKRLIRNPGKQEKDEFKFPAFMLS